MLNTNEITGSLFGEVCCKLQALKKIICRGELQCKECGIILNIFYIDEKMYKTTHVKTAFFFFFLSSQLFLFVGG